MWILGDHDMPAPRRAWWLSLLGGAHFHTVRRKCININSQATSGVCKSTHTCSQLLLLRDPPPPTYTFSHIRFLTPSSSRMHYHHPHPTDTHDAQNTLPPSHASARTQSSWLTHNWAVICVTSGSCVYVCTCVCVSGTLGWECTVGCYCQHAQAGVYGQRRRTWFDHHLRDRENMTNMPVSVRENPRFLAAFHLLHTRGLHAQKTYWGHKQNH